MKLSHVTETGRAQMVDVGRKIRQRRRARAAGFIRLQPETVRLVRENQIRKGDVLTTAQIAGIQAAKRTADTVPLCHPLVLDHIDVSLQIKADGISAESAVTCEGKTGVEMEALAAVSAALLTVYDMCKAVDQQMTIQNIRLVEKVKEDAGNR